MTRRSRTLLLTLGIFVALIGGGALWVRHEYHEFTAAIEAGRAERIADSIFLARQTRELSVSYTGVSDEEWRTIGEIGPLKSVSLYQPDGSINGRPMLEHVRTKALSLHGCRITVEGLELCPPNDSIRSLHLHRVQFDGDAAAFLAALPRLDALSIVRTEFGNDGRTTKRSKKVSRTPPVYRRSASTAPSSASACGSASSTSRSSSIC